MNKLLPVKRTANAIAALQYAKNVQSAKFRFNKHMDSPTIEILVAKHTGFIIELLNGGKCAVARIGADLGCYISYRKNSRSAVNLVIELVKD